MTRMLAILMCVCMASLLQAKGMQVPQCMQSITGSTAGCVGAFIIAMAAGGCGVTAEVWRKKSTGKKVERDISQVFDALKSIRLQLADGAAESPQKQELVKQERVLTQQLEILCEKRPLILQWFVGRKPHGVSKAAGGLWSAFAVSGAFTIAACLLVKHNWKREIGSFRGL